MWLQDTRDSRERLQRGNENLALGLRAPTAASLTALLDTKDARILSLEREVGLLENEINRMRGTSSRSSGQAAVTSGGLLSGGLLGSIWGSNASLVTPPPSTDDSRFLQVVQEREKKARMQVEEARQEIQKRDQEILTMTAKMKTLEEQHQDYTRHIMVLKESLVAKEEHYNMLQADVEELRQRLEEKNKTIEKKTQQALQATQDRNKMNNEVTEMKDHMDIKDRKISVLQRKLDLHSANEQLHSEGRAAMEMQEQMQVFEQKEKSIDMRNKQLDEREQTLMELESRLQAKKNQLDNLEIELSKSASTSNGMASSEASQQLNEMRKALGKQEEQITLLQKEKKAADMALNQAQTETERLLQVMQLGQEEQFSKDKTIMELQEALKAARNTKRGSIASSSSTGGHAPPPGVTHGPPPVTGPSSVPTQAPPPAQEPPQKPQGTAQSMLDGFAAPLSGTAAGNLAASAAEKASASAQAAKATLEQAKNAAQSTLNEISQLEQEGRERERQLYVNQLEVDIKLKDSLIESLTEEQNKKTSRITELEDEISALENELRKNGRIDELEELVVVVKQKNERIESLEEALRQNVAFTTDLEMQRRDEDDRRREIYEKLEQLEKRLEHTRNSPSMKCLACKSLMEKLNEATKGKKEVLQERKRHFNELFDLKHEALTAALSERDAHIALLELNITHPSRKNREQILSLMEQRSRLTEQINRQNEDRIKLMQKLDFDIRCSDIT